MASKRAASLGVHPSVQALGLQHELAVATKALDDVIQESKNANLKLSMATKMADQAAAQNINAAHGAAADARRVKLLQKRILTAEARLREKKNQLRDLADDSRAVLAAVVSHGVDEYFENARANRHSIAQTSSTVASSDSGTEMRRLRQTEANLVDSISRTKSRMKQLGDELESVQKENSDLATRLCKSESALFRHY